MGQENAWDERVHGTRGCVTAWDESVCGTRVCGTRGKV